jgi:SAM-dependent methyltransferase
VVNQPPLAPQGRLRWSVVSRQVSRLAPTSILELGCGLGGVGVRLAQLASYTAAEPDEQCWSVARERLAPLGGEVIHGDHNKVPAGATFDLVCAFEVLEHIADDVAALGDWMGFVRPGGHLMLSVPQGPERFGPADQLVGHYRRYTATRLGELLTEAGAADVRVRHYGWPLGYLLESVRNRMASRRIGEAASEVEERTSTSGRTFQPRAAVTGTVIRLGVAPFALLQDVRPTAGPGLIALARRPV